MKAAHESPDKHKGSERHLPARKAHALSTPVLEARGVAFDGLGNRALLSLLRSGRLQREALSRICRVCGGKSGSVR
jgi:hypothetical protein